jgi:adenosine kinase
VRIVVTGSIAQDYLMSFEGRIREQIVPEELHRISLSFLVDDLQVRRGGNGANIAFGIAQLGLRPVLAGAAGADFGDYRSWLDRHGVDTASVRVSELHHTARFFCTTDLDHNQIATFYAGAMTEAREIELGPIVERIGGVDLLIVSPDDPEAMRRHTAEARELGIPFLADPSQQLVRMDGDEVDELVTGARYLIANDYEMALLETKTGWRHEDVLARVDVCVTTHGAKGSVIERGGDEPIKVLAAPEKAKVDPTGVGDAYRAGFVVGQAWGVGLERSGQLGSLLASYVLEHLGTQEYEVAATAFLQRFGDSFGDESAAPLRPFLR